MPSEPRITVGIPFHDEERHLAASVRSILRQSFTDFEVLLVDDGSNDRSLEIARSFDDPRVRVISDGARKRLPNRLNQIAWIARAPFVARMDADDVAHPERLKRELELLEREDLDAVGTWIALVDPEGAPIVTTEAREPRTVSAADVVRSGLLPHATMLARRAWLIANPYDEALYRAEDRELFCRTHGRTRFGIVPEVLYVVRVTIDADFVRQYAESQSQNRIILRRYGPAAMGPARTASAVFLTRVKEKVTLAAVQLGLGNLLLERRGRKPTANELVRIAESLAVAHSP